MSDLTERIQLTLHERELILKHGHQFERLEKALRRWPKDQMIRTISMSEYELSMPIGESSRSRRNRQGGRSREYAEKYGDGELDILY